MIALVAEMLPELLVIAFFATGAGILTTVSIYLEELGLETLATGDPLFGVGVMVVGALAFYFGPYLMGYSRLRPRVTVWLDHRPRRQARRELDRS